MGQQALVYLVIALLVVVLAAAAVRSALRSRSNASDLSTAARARGWTFEARGSSPVDVGWIFNQPNRGFYRNVIKGSAASTPFVAFEYDALDNGVHGFVTVNLPRFLPTLEVGPPDR